MGKALVVLAFHYAKRELAVKKANSILSRTISRGKIISLCSVLLTSYSEYFPGFETPQCQRYLEKLDPVQWRNITVVRVGKLTVRRGLEIWA